MKARTQTSFLFDLDGTLIDSVYDHVTSWNLALQEAGINVSAWRLHRRIGMSGGLFANALARETGIEIDETLRTRLRELHAKHYNAISARTRPLPGAKELLAYLSENEIPWAIATSGRMATAGPVLKILGVDPSKHVVITRDMVRYAKPDPTCSLRLQKNLASILKVPALSEMRSGTCLRQNVRVPWALVFLPVAMAPKNSNAPVPIVFMMIQPIYWRILMKLAGGGNAAFLLAEFRLKDARGDLLHHSW